MSCVADAITSRARSSSSVFDLSASPVSDSKSVWNIVFASGMLTSSMILSPGVLLIVVSFFEEYCCICSYCTAFSRGMGVVSGRFVLPPVGDSVCVKPRQRVDFGAVRVSDFEVEVGAC